MTDVKIYRINPRPIPGVLASLSEFQELSPQEQGLFSERLLYIEEITKKIDEWTAGVETDLRAFVDRIELDLYINLGAPRGEEKISSWLIHSSWVGDLSSRQMRRALPPQLAKEIDRAVPSVNADIQEFTASLTTQNAALNSALTGFYGGHDLVTVMAFLHAIDALLVSMLLTALKMRFLLAFE